MTIALALKVHDGLILAADSASTILNQVNGSTSIVQVYNHANKIFNLRKGLPIGAMAWGAGAIGPASVSTLMKDLRVRFSGGDDAHKDWHIDEVKYSVDAVAKQVREFIYEEHYKPTL